jgi:hypothetical protein
VAALIAPLRFLEGLGYRFMRLSWTLEGGAKGRLNLVPLPLCERGQFATTLNILAIHPARQALLACAFARA